MGAFDFRTGMLPTSRFVASEIARRTFCLLISCRAGIEPSCVLTDENIASLDVGSRFQRPLAGLGAQHLTELGYVVRRERGGIDLEGRGHC